MATCDRTLEGSFLPSNLHNPSIRAFTETFMQIQTPDWVKHAVFYQIFPDRFARGEDRQTRVPSTTIALEPWDSPPTLQGYKGGNLWGVLEKLDYLQDLGITALYFTPIFQSASNHRYHTHDYYQVDPILGGNEAFSALIEEAHRRNIAVVLDGVFNHASRGFYFFNDILEHGPNSPWLDWFKIEGWPLSAYDGSKPANYVGWWNNRALPEFNHENPDVREYIMGIAEYWLKVGIDGWRLDVPFEITADGFWQEFRDRVKAINPEAYIVGEVWGDSRPWLDGTQFDGVMNYLFTGPTIAFTGGDRVVKELVEEPAYDPYPPLDAAGYRAKIEQLFDLYDWEIHQAQLNLLDSHDTARIGSVVSEDIPSHELAVLLMMTFPGAPCVYYGNEVGLNGRRDPDCRRAFPPSEGWNHQLLDTYKQAIALRNQNRALRTGEYRVLFAEGMVYAFARSLPAQTLVIAVNSGTEAVTVSFKCDGLSPKATLLFGTGEFSQQVEGGVPHLTITLPERTGCVVG